MSVDTSIREPHTEMERAWNILYVGLHSGINEYVYPDLIAYRPDIIILAEEMRERVFEYFSEIAELLELIQVALTLKIDEQPFIIGFAAYVLDLLKIEDRTNTINSKSWSDDTYNKVIEKIEKLNHIKNDIEIKKIKTNIRKKIDKINEIQWKIKNIIEYEKLK